jgi:hypothetical protein
MIDTSSYDYATECLFRAASTMGRGPARRRNINDHQWATFVVSVASGESLRAIEHAFGWLRSRALDCSASSFADHYA